MPYKQKRIDSGLKRAALYARVSTEEQAMHGVSLDAQKERLVQYAKENDLTVVDLYVDEGISARKRYTRRPEFMRMLEDVKQGKIDVVLFIKLDRWFRSIADYYEVQALLDRYKVQWIATEEEYDTTTANGRLALNIKLAIAQDESDRTSERIKFVFSNMVKEGRVITGKTPLGYKIENKRLVIDEETAPLAKDVFETYNNTRSMRETSRRILDKHGKSIDLKSMKTLLTNPIYIGTGYGIPNWCPALIDEKTFELTASLIQVRSQRTNTARSDRVYLFTGLAFCGCCGRRLSTYTCHNTKKDGTKTEFIYYRCLSYNFHQCTFGKQMNQNKLEEWLEKNMGVEIDRHNAEIDKMKASHKKKSVDAAKIMAKIEKLKNLYLADMIPLEMYEKDYTALMKSLESAKQDDLPKKIDPAVFREFLEHYKTLSQEGKKAFWGRTLESITLLPDGGITVQFRS